MPTPRLRSLLLLVPLLVLVFGPSPQEVPQEVPSRTPTSRRAAAGAAPTSRPAASEAAPASRPQEAPAGRRGGRGEGDDAKKKEEAKKKKKDRKGIPVTLPLLKEKCGLCHKESAPGLMSRVSFMRKTPEGWETSLKRMIRHHDLKISPGEAREMVRYLANEHGLARSEARRALYEAERRVHWSEAKEDEDLRKSCGGCHTLGRVLSQQRDAEEWKLLKATHLAFFPLADFQAFRGRRRRGPPSGGSGGGPGGPDSNRSRGPDRADKVLGELAKKQGLFTDDWNSWTVNRRKVPLADVWTVIGQDPTHGAIRGEVVIREIADEVFETEWSLSCEDGATMSRKGKGLLYAGYSWRGRSKPTAGAKDQFGPMREVLLLSEDWESMEGRLFTGSYSELGIDVTLHRQTGAPRIFDVEGGAVTAPAKDHEMMVWGESFPRAVSPGDFELGTGVEVTGAQRLSETRVRLLVDVASDARLGPRMISYRARKGPVAVRLYDTIDYIKIFPEQGFARVGGKMRPKQYERFEAWAMHRGPDGKPWTKDDQRVKRVRPKWGLEEFPVRLGDDDVRFVGEINPENGHFTPALDGPNPERKWQANNIGDVYVTAYIELEVPVRKEKPKPEAGADKKKGEEHADAGAKPAASEEATLTKAAASKDDSASKTEKRLFRARGHLLVSVPIYIQWDRYVWDQR